ncbi:transketolase [Domibacillus robiginosus]|uniref:transketolase n=1 Tax=Domibacillus robiginosus TaxID=1071054 RepID=UPI00067B63D9|nr:transketolase [Domibacillus robiginosus]
MSSIENLSVTTLRMLSIDAVETANSGHPGMPMGAAPMAYTLWSRFLTQSSRHPRWWNRDRFVLSAGHGSALLYSLLHVSGYDLTMDDLKNFRKWGSKTPGHPEYGHTEGVEATTGPLGQGFAMAVGMAIAERYLSAAFNRPSCDIIDHRTYVICGDGDLMEGVSQEAASLAGHLKLSKLTVLFDSNHVCLDGPTSLTFTEDTQKKFEAYGWNVLSVADGNNLQEIEQAIGQSHHSDRPTLIIVNTIIGYGSPAKAGRSDAHGSPLGKKETERVREAYSWPHPPFYVPEEVKQHFQAITSSNEQQYMEWEDKWKRYQFEFPDLAARLIKAMKEPSLQAEEKNIPLYKEGQLLATRQASEDILNAYALNTNLLIGGAADLASSNKTNLHQKSIFSVENPGGANLYYGVREFAMAAIMNGISLHGGLRPFGGTFLAFSDYIRPAIRLSALMKQPVVYVFTHDSIAYGEDGPTHQPIEHIPSLRLIPDLIVMRPADARETAAAYQFAFQQTALPIAMILTRQDVPVLPYSSADPETIARGAYTYYQSPLLDDAVLFIATGSEVHLADQVRSKLEEQGMNVIIVSMPSKELFEQQSKEYQQGVLPPSIRKRVVIEMAHPCGWEKYAGEHGLIIGIDRFGASAPGEKMMEQFGFTPEAITAKIMDYVGKNILGAVQ